MKRLCKWGWLVEVVGSGSGSWTPRGHVPVGNVLQIDPLEVRSLVQT
jgi:hypothetical protein